MWPRVHTVVRMVCWKRGGKNEAVCLDMIVPFLQLSTVADRDVSPRCSWLSDGLDSRPSTGATCNPSVTQQCTPGSPHSLFNDNVEIFSLRSVKGKVNTRITGARHVSKISLLRYLKPINLKLNQVARVNNGTADSALRGGVIA